MKHLIKPFALSLGLTFALAGATQAACYVEYKAKQDNPLRLHYGVMQIGQSSCPSAAQAAQQAAQRLSGTGWTLLNVVGVSDQPPSAKKRANAGDFYLRY